jgi:hypothetical protein
VGGGGGVGRWRMNTAVWVGMRSMNGAVVENGKIKCEYCTLVGVGRWNTNTMVAYGKVE